MKNFQLSTGPPPRGQGTPSGGPAGSERASGFSDVEKASRVYVRNELLPFQKRQEELNQWIGEEVIHFTK